MRRNYLGRRCRMQQYYNHPWSSIWLSNISIALQQTRGDAGKYEDWQSFAVNFASEAAASASLLGKFELAIEARVTVAKALILSNRSSAAIVYASLTSNQLEKPLKAAWFQEAVHSTINAKQKRPRWWLVCGALGGENDPLCDSVLWVLSR